MHKRMDMGIMLVVAVLAALVFLYATGQNNVILETDKEEGNALYVRVGTAQSENRVLLWQDGNAEEGPTGYFFCHPASIIIKSVWVIRVKAA